MGLAPTQQSFFPRAFHAWGRGRPQEGAKLVSSSTDAGASTARVG